MVGWASRYSSAKLSAWSRRPMSESMSGTERRKSGIASLRVYSCGEQDPVFQHHYNFHHISEIVHTVPLRGLAPLPPCPLPNPRFVISKQVHKGTDRTTSRISASILTPTLCQSLIPRKFHRTEQVNQTDRDLPAKRGRAPQTFVSSIRLTTSSTPLCLLSTPSPAARSASAWV